MVVTGIDDNQNLSNMNVDIASLSFNVLSIKQGVTDEGYEVSLIRKTR